MIVVVDGDRRTPLSMEAMMLGLWATVPETLKMQVAATALEIQTQMNALEERGEAFEVRIQISRVARPTGNGVVTPG